MSSEPQQGVMADLAVEVINQIHRLDAEERNDRPLSLKYKWGGPKHQDRGWISLGMELKEGLVIYVLRHKLPRLTRLDPASPERVLHFKEVKPALLLMAGIATQNIRTGSTFDLMHDDRILSGIKVNGEIWRSEQALRSLFKVIECASEPEPPAKKKARRANANATMQT